MKNTGYAPKTVIRKVADVPEELAARIFKDVPTEGYSKATIENMKRIRLRKYLQAANRCRKIAPKGVKALKKAKAEREAIKQKEKEKEKRRKIAAKKEKLKYHKRWIKKKRENRKIRNEQKRKAAALAAKEKKRKEKERLKAIAKRKAAKKKRKSRKKRKPSYVFPVLRFSYRVALFTNKKMLKWVSRTYKMYKTAVSVIDRLISENPVEYPRKVILAHHKISPAEYEYVILERYCDEDSSLVENDMGKLVPHQTVKINVSGDWVVRGKYPVQMEEDFYVWGYDERTERKTFRWIMENIVYPISDSESDLCRLFKYRNKVIIRRDDNSFEIVTCKDSDEAIRLYETIERTAQNEGHTRVACCGSVDKWGDRRTELEREIAEKTGWTRRKIVNYKVNKKKTDSENGEDTD